MANYKQLSEFLNASIVAWIEAMEKMGLNSDLVWGQMANALKDGASMFLKDAGLSLEGSDVKTLSEDFAKKIKEVGFCQRADLLEVTDDKVVIDLGECILAPATRKLRNNDLEMIPPCPMLAILYSNIEEKTNKRGYIEKALYKPQENSTIFTIHLENE